MARERINTGGEAVADAEESTNGEQEELFPELDTKGNSLHKRLFSAAKDFKKKALAHAEGIGTLKVERDAAEQKFLGLMHEAKLTQFKHKGVTGRINEKKESASVQVTDDASD